MSVIRRDDDLGRVIRVEDDEKDVLTVADIKKVIEGYPDSHEVLVFTDYKEWSSAKMIASNKETKNLVLFTVTDRWVEEVYNNKK